MSKSKTPEFWPLTGEQMKSNRNFALWRKRGAYPGKMEWSLRGEKLPNAFLLAMSLNKKSAYLQCAAVFAAHGDVGLLLLDKETIIDAEEWSSLEVGYSEDGKLWDALYNIRTQIAAREARR